MISAKLIAACALCFRLHLEKISSVVFLAPWMIAGDDIVATA
jgi:hypothetical protein